MLTGFMIDARTITFPNILICYANGLHQQRRRPYFNLFYVGRKVRCKRCIALLEGSRLDVYGSKRDKKKLWFLHALGRPALMHKHLDVTLNEKEYFRGIFWLIREKSNLNIFGVNSC